MSEEERIPWWAVSILEFPRGDPHAPIRKARQGAFVGNQWHTDEMQSLWDEVVLAARQLADERPIEWWRDQCTKDKEVAARVRRGALFSERAFAEFVELKDDESNQMHLVDFHVRMIRGMRQHNPAEILVPLEHGKSFHSSITVSLMDWAEWNNADEGRFYWNDAHVVKWINKLMFYVEHNDSLHKIFPWIRRPQKGDPSTQWSQDGFSIGGRDIDGRSFEPLTARAFSVGNRYARTGGDDWVTEGNSESDREQDKLFRYWNSGPLTMTKHLSRVSPYGTAWPGAYYCGTLYDRRDVGSRIMKQLFDNHDFVLRLDVYPEGAGSPEIVLWPEGRAPDYIAGKARTMLPHVFNARYRNRVMVDAEQPFRDDKVEEAQMLEYQFGVVPDGARACIGFDPASGSKSRFAANPAICVYAEVDENVEMELFYSHWVKWQRLHGYDFERQCQTIVEWAREYKLDVVIEKNTLQTSYKDHLKAIAPDVKVVDHHTGAQKWDPMNGIATFTPLFNNNRTVIHTGDAPMSELKALITELVEYPQSRTKDLVMAFWFARAYLSKRRKAQLQATILQTPSYLDGLTNYWNLT